MFLLKIADFLLTVTHKVGDTSAFTIGSVVASLILGINGVFFNTDFVHVIATSVVGGGAGWVVKKGLDIVFDYFNNNFNKNGKRN